MKLKRIFALIGAIGLAGLFILAIIMYAMGLMTRVLKPSDPFEDMDGDAGGNPLQDKTDMDSKDDLRESKRTK